MTSSPVLRELAHGPWAVDPESRAAPRRSLRHIVNVGGHLCLSVCGEAEAALGPAAKIHNLYGATESSCTTWTYPGAAALCSDSTGNAPAGMPQPGTVACILTSELLPSPDGEVGEVCLGGPFLARGYLGEGRLTEERFVKALGGQVYRTGDLGRWVAHPRGEELEIVGRMDRQVNLRGLRVEPEEIESVIA